MNSQLRIPRGRRGATTVTVAVLGVVIAACAAIEGVSLARHRQTMWFDVHAVARSARTTELSSAAVLGVGIGVGVIGLLLLILGLTPGRHRLETIDSGDERIAVAITPRSLARSLEAAAQIDGISSASADKVRGRRVRITATTTLADPGSLADRVKTSAERQLATLGLAKPRTVSVRLRHRSA